MLVLPATLTHREAPDAIRMLAQSISQASGARAEGSAQPLMIDASALVQFDSSALAVLLECRRLVGPQGRGIELRNAPAKLHQLARLYGVASLVGSETAGQSA